MVNHSSSGSDELIDWLNDQIRFHGTSAAANDPAIQGHIAFLQRAIARLNGVAQAKPGYVEVPQAALDWLFGEKPDVNGKWFGEYEDDILPSKTWIKRTYWWRSKFRELCALSSTQRCTWPNCDQPSGHDYCYSHCLADRGAAVASTRRETEA